MGMRSDTNLQQLSKQVTLSHGTEKRERMGGREGGEGEDR